MRIFQSGKNLMLKFGYSPSLIKKVKNMKSARWKPNVKAWEVLDNEHNRFLLEEIEEMFPSLRWETKIKPISDFKRALFLHQKNIASFGLNRRAFFIAATMGTGKTLASIEIMERSGTRKWWYIAPKSALLSVRLEMRKWNCTVTPIFFTYEGLVKKLKHYDGEAPEGVIFDESHKLKNNTSIRSQSAAHLAEAMRDEHDDPFIICMTGTPAPKDPLDWWAQLEIVQPGFVPEGDIYKFRKRVANVVTVDLGEDDGTAQSHSYSTVESWKEDELANFRRSIENKICIFVDKADCLDLPEKVYTEYVLPMTPQVEARYKFLLANSGTTIECLNKCRQLSDGFIYSDDKAIRVTSNPKIELLEDLVEGKNRVVIFAGYIESVKWIRERMTVLGWKTINSGDRNFEDEIIEFMDTGIEKKIAFVNHPKSGGTGLNLTASDTIIYYSNDFDGEARFQSEDRIHRPGCVGANIIDLYHLPTDKYVRCNLENKKKLQGVTMKEMMLELEHVEWGRG